MPAPSARALTSQARFSRQIGTFVRSAICCFLASTFFGLLCSASLSLAFCSFFFSVNASFRSSLATSCAALHLVPNGATPFAISSSTNFSFCDNFSSESHLFASASSSVASKILITNFTTALDSGVAVDMAVSAFAFISVTPESAKAFSLAISGFGISGLTCFCMYFFLSSLKMLLKSFGKAFSKLAFAYSPNHCRGSITGEGAL